MDFDASTKKRKRPSIMNIEVVGICEHFILDLKYLFNVFY